MLPKSIALLYCILFSKIIFLQFSEALRCYTCTYVPTSSDTSCLNNPDAVIGQKFTSCSKKYCVILRQELQKPSGVVNTFLRGCEDKPLYLNNVVEDPTYKTFYRSCTTDLCNTGDGIRSSGGVLDPDAGAGSNMIIPGRSGAAVKFSKVHSSGIAVAVILIIVMGT